VGARGPELSRREMAVAPDGAAVARGGMRGARLGRGLRL
jgi:hypothetical protein